MRHNYSGIYGRVELRPLNAGDAELMRRLRNRRRDRFVTSEEISEQQQREWFDSYQDKAGDYMFSVYHLETGKWVGAVGIYDLDEETGQAEFGRLMVDSGIVGEHGLGTYATICASEIAFAVLKVKKLILEVYADNIAAIKTYDRSGFKKLHTIKDPNGREMIQMELTERK